MAKKKTGKKKAHKKGRTAAQKAATAKLVALNKGKKAHKKTGKKKARKKSSKKRAKETAKGGWRQHSVGVRRTVVYNGPAYAPGKRYKPTIGEQFAGERGGQRFHGPMTPSQALEAANREIARLSRGKGARSRKSTKKHKPSGVVTAASILNSVKASRGVAYVCAGKKYTGCGGGKKGSHVVGHLR